MWLSYRSILDQFIFLQFTAVILSTGPVHEDIIKWWNKLSIQRPLKCNLNKSYRQPIHTVGILSNIMKPQRQRPILYSHPCHYYDQLEQLFIYKGDRKITFIYLLSILGWTRFEVRSFAVRISGRGYYVFHQNISPEFCKFSSYFSSFIIRTLKLQ